MGDWGIPGIQRRLGRRQVGLGKLAQVDSQVIEHHAGIHHIDVERVFSGGDVMRRRAKGGAAQHIGRPDGAVLRRLQIDNLRHFAVDGRGIAKGPRPGLIRCVGIACTVNFAAGFAVVTVKSYSNAGAALARA